MNSYNVRFSYIENGERKFFDTINEKNVTDTITSEVKTYTRLHSTVCEITLKNIPPHALTRFYPFVCTVNGIAGTKQYIHEGFHSYFATFTENMTVTTEDFVAIYYEPGNGLFARTLYPLKFNERTRITVKDGVGEAEIECDIPASFEGSELTVTVVMSDGRIVDGMRAYESLLPDFKKDQTVVGYNTWDYYFTDIDMENIEENLAFIKNTPYLRDNLKYFTVDDGWQTGWGEWYANRRFPNGTSGLADLIKSYGLIPGIWTAPLCISPTCSFAPRKMKGFVETPYGDPANINGYFLIDPTHPDGKAFITELFTRLYNDGFRLFKVDYVSLLLNVQRFYDKNAAPYDAMRELFNTIRSCVGDSIILGCSAPKGTCTGAVDVGRTGMDIHNKWGQLTWAVEHSQYYYNLNHRIWVNDPDFLIVRGEDTDKGDAVRNPRCDGEHSPNPSRWRCGRDFNLDEARTWAAYIMALGGCVNLSDRLTLLNDAGLKIIEKALKYRSTETGIPQNQFSEDLASVWKQGNRLYLFNFTEEDREFTVDFGCDAYELWSERTLSPADNKITISVKKHASAVLIPVSEV